MIIFMIMALTIMYSCYNSQDTPPVPDPFPDAEASGDANIEVDSNTESTDTGSGIDTNSDTECIADMCDTPPIDICHNEYCIRIYNHEGYCVREECHYSYTIKCCRWGCEEISCLPKPCHLIKCNSPPLAECLDEEHLLKYEDWGECDDGHCFYEYEIIECNCNWDGTQFYCQ